LYGQLLTGGERLALSCELAWVARELAPATDGRLTAEQGRATVQVIVERTRKPFPTQGWRVLARDAWARGGEVVVRDAATSGFDLLLTACGGVPTVVLRWRPPRRSRLASALLRSRARLLRRAVLLQFPVFWVAATRGRAPVHASLVDAGPAGPALLVGPSGSGKTTLVEEEVLRGGSFTTDNLAVSDGTTVWGVIEPVRSERTLDGARAPHGRREGNLANRVDDMRPRLLVALRRGRDMCLDPCDAADAARALVASTYAAGELRRYWPLHALLALGSGTGPAHPPVSNIADQLARGCRCAVASLPQVRGVRLATLASGEGTPAWT
jgi:hypothetical protein